MQKSHFSLLNKLKNTASAQLCAAKDKEFDKMAVGKCNAT